MLFGLFCIVGWLARLGFLADLLSRPVLVGYLTGVALTMIIGELGAITDVRVTGQQLSSKLVSFARQLGDIRPSALAVAGATLLFLFVVPHVWPRLPAPLFAVTLAIVAVTVLGLDRHGVSVVGPVLGGLPHVAAPSAADIRHLLPPALGVALVGYTDNILTGSGVRCPATREHRPEARAPRPRRSQPGIGPDARLPGQQQRQPHRDRRRCRRPHPAHQSRHGRRDGARPPHAEAASSRSSPSLRWEPWSSTPPLRLIDIAEFRRLARFRRSELLLALATTALVVVVGVLYGVLVAIGLSILDAPSTGRPSARRYRGPGAWHGRHA